MYTTIFFDLDDTIWDTMGNAKVCLNELFEDYDIDRYYDSFESFYEVYFNNTVLLWERYSHGLIDKQTIISERFSYPFRQFRGVAADMPAAMNDDFFRRIVTKTNLIDGAIEILDYLKGRYKMHIISNGFTELQSSKINGSGLGGYFEHIVLSDAVGFNKPDRRIFDYLLNTASVNSDEVIMIGDNINADIAGAKNVSIRYGSILIGPRFPIVLILHM